MPISKQNLSYEEKQIAAYYLAEKDSFAQHPDYYWREVESATSKPVSKMTKGKKDKLTVIEGIGPKIAKLLNEDNILTFADLAKTKVSTLSAVLKNAGPRFSMHKPNSWPKQARLARDGKMDELKALQDTLDGGK